MRPGVGKPLRPRRSPVALSERQWKRVMTLLSAGGTVTDRQILHVISEQLNARAWTTIGKSKVENVI